MVTLRTSMKMVLGIASVKTVTASVQMRRKELSFHNSKNTMLGDQTEAQRIRTATSSVTLSSTRN